MLYTGITTDVEKRIETHNKGKGAKYLTGNKLPVTLKYTAEFENRSEASKEEYRIKQLYRHEKYQMFQKKIELNGNTYIRYSEDCWYIWLDDEKHRPDFYIVIGSSSRELDKKYQRILRERKLKRILKNIIS